MVHVSAAAKVEHVAAPPGFKLEGDDEFMFAFHAAVGPQYLTSGRARTITLKFVAYTVMSLWQTLTYVPDTDGACAPSAAREIAHTSPVL